MIKPILTNNMDKFYNNKDLKELVNLSLTHLNDDIFDNILSLISTDNEKIINRLLFKFKKDFENFDGIYNKLDILIRNIQKNIDYNHLRGAFLELLTYEYLRINYNPTELSRECFVKINEFKSSKTVDVFARCDLKGFICECKVGHRNFDADDISNLNEIYSYSGDMLSPYIISLSDENHIKNHLYEVLRNDESNRCNVHLSDITIICSDNFSDFFN